MKYGLFICLFLVSGVISAQNRNTLWLSGIGATSSRWDNTIKAAKDAGYKLT